MNIFGVGPAELVIILLLMLMVAGPQRMARWAYIMGRYAAQMRALWQETSTVIKKELENAGVEPEVVDKLGELANPRTRKAAISGPLDHLVDEMKKPVVDTLEPVNQVIKEVNVISLDPAAGTPVEDSPEPAPDDEAKAPDASQQATPGRYDAWTPN